MATSASADTIAAIATPHGESAIGALRVSGPDTMALARAIWPTIPVEPRRMRYVRYVALSGEPIDDVTFVAFAHGASYTGEPSLEIFPHGNPLILRLILDDLVARGCRLAEPGEFTRRAFLNGRMDLSQAEAVADVIAAKSRRALEVANAQLSGAVGRRVDRDVECLLEVIAELEAYIDFPEEDLPPEDVDGPAQRLRALRDSLAELSATSRYKSLLDDGFRAAIIGAPNAGKSSLLNAFAGADRSIVSESPGTTRDYVEERIMIGPFLMRLIDTAGLRESTDAVEKSGMERALCQADRADIVLLVVDGAQPSPALPAFDERLANRGDQLIVVESKADLGRSVDVATLHPEAPHVPVSVLTGEGLGALRAEVIRVIEAGAGPRESGGLVVGARHAAALDEAQLGIEAALGKIRADDPVELAVSELRNALAALGSIVGGIDNEAMLDKLFANFCIGK